jgi:hypothetical protein
MWPVHWPSLNFANFLLIGKLYSISIQGWSQRLAILVAKFPFHTGFKGGPDSKPSARRFDAEFSWCGLSAQSLQIEGS